MLGSLGSKNNMQRTNTLRYYHSLWYEPLVDLRVPRLHRKWSIGLRVRLSRQQKLDFFFACSLARLLCTSLPPTPPSAPSQRTSSPDLKELGTQPYCHLPTPCQSSRSANNGAFLSRAPRRAHQQLSSNSFDDRTSNSSAQLPQTHSHNAIAQTVDALPGWV